jgi:hypothetical protein
MSIQHNIPKQSNRLLNILVALAMFLSTGLVACGGGGGDGGSTPTDGSAGGISYVGNTNPASITTTNASAIVDDLIGGSGVIESVSGVQPQAVVESSGREDIVSAVNTLLSLTRSTTVTGIVGGGDYNVAATVPVEESLPCDSGFMSLTGSIDDQTGTGVVTVTLNACTTEGETINGTGTLTVNAMDLTYFEITDGLFSFPLLTVTSSESDVSMSFDMHMQLSIAESRERLTLNLVGQDNTSGDMVKYESFVEDNLYFPSVLMPASYTQILRGRLYDSTQGYVDFFVPEVSPLGYSTIEQFYPSIGVLVFDGDNCNLRLVTQSGTHVSVNLDGDGDGVHETGVTLLWEEIGQPVAADIGDNDGDGMHNSWETLFSLNPDDATDALLDADGDGISNYQEYLDRTDPTASSAQAVEYQYTGNPYTFATSPYTTNMFVTARIRLDNPLPSDLSFSDISGLSGFVLTMNDGIETLTSASSEVTVGSASISTDATGSIVGWQLGLLITNDVVILSANYSSATSDSTVDFATAIEDAYVAGNAGTWSGPTVIP